VLAELVDVQQVLARRAATAGHGIHQGDQAIRLSDDDGRVFAQCGVVQLLVEQLCRATQPTQRILHFVRQLLHHQAAGIHVGEDFGVAGDALARKEITQQEYDQMTMQTRTMLQNMSGFVGGRGAGGASQMLADPETMSQINAILTPEQQTKLADLTAKITENMQARADAQNRGGIPFQPGQIPVMELDRLDQSVAAMQQMTAAARQMMEAMRGLKDAATPTDR